MVEAYERSDLGRLEDFITLAKQGKDVQAAIELIKQPVATKVHPGATEEMRSDVAMYLLLAHYTFKVGGITRHVSKVYMYGSAAESLNEAKTNSSIANDRLRVDYQRLREAAISLEERFF